MERGVHLMVIVVHTIRTIQVASPACHDIGPTLLLLYNLSEIKAIPVRKGEGVIGLHINQRTYGIDFYLTIFPETQIRNRCVIFPFLHFFYQFKGREFSFAAAYYINGA